MLYFSHTQPPFLLFPSLFFPSPTFLKWTLESFVSHGHITFPAVLPLYTNGNIAYGLNYCKHSTIFFICSWTFCNSTLKIIWLLFHTFWGQIERVGSVWEVCHFEKHSFPCLSPLSPSCLLTLLSFSNFFFLVHFEMSGLEHSSWLPRHL